MSKNSIPNATPAVNKPRTLRERVRRSATASYVNEAARQAEEVGRSFLVFASHNLDADDLSKDDEAERSLVELVCELGRLIELTNTVSCEFSNLVEELPEVTDG
jgi:hypothetical protein